MDIEKLLDQIKGEDKTKAWAAINTLVTVKPETEQEKKAKAYACACMAEQLFARRKVGTAIDFWQEAVENDPMNASYRRAFTARGLMPAGMNQQSLNEATRAMNLDPDNPESWRLIGLVQMSLYNVPKAIEAFEKLMEIDPDNPVSYLDRVDIALETGDWETADKLTKKILEIGGPQRGNAIHQRGLLAFRQGRPEEALKIWDEALEAGCDHPEVVAWNQSVALLAIGRYRDGWRRHEARCYQTRDVSMSIATHRCMMERLFNNEPPPLKLHVHQEMGFGDTFAMVRYLPMLVEKGYQVQLEVMEPLLELMRDSFPGIEVMKRAPLFPYLLGVPEFDYHIPALSLPRLFGTDTNTVPWRGPYLKANPQRVEKYKLTGPSIGIAWSSGIRHEQGIWLNHYGKRKSMSYDTFSPIIDAYKHCTFVSLQVGPEREQQDKRVIDLLPKEPSWSETAALIENLDLVITVDTGLAHLVGAMGKPVWILLHTEGSWHWMMERPNVSWNDTSPWYPTARLFRSKNPNEWGPVVNRVASELKDHFKAAA